MVECTVHLFIMGGCIKLPQQPHSVSMVYVHAEMNYFACLLSGVCLYLCFYFCFCLLLVHLFFTSSIKPEIYHYTIAYKCCVKNYQSINN